MSLLTDSLLQRNEFREFQSARLLGDTGCKRSTTASDCGHYPEFTWSLLYKKACQIKQLLLQPWCKLSRTRYPAGNKQIYKGSIWFNQIICQIKTVLLITVMQSKAGLQPMHDQIPRNASA